jgi:hypothetical protein
MQPTEPNATSSLPFRYGDRIVAKAKHWYHKEIKCVVTAIDHDGVLGVVAIPGQMMDSDHVYVVKPEEVVACEFPDQRFERTEQAKDEPPSAAVLYYFDDAENDYIACARGSDLRKEQAEGERTPFHGELRYMHFASYREAGDEVIMVYTPEAWAISKGHRDNPGPIGFIPVSKLPKNSRTEITDEMVEAAVNAVGGTADNRFLFRAALEAALNG